MNPTLKRAYLGVRRHWLQHRNNQEILKISRVVLRNSSVPDKGPVLMFNASTRVSGISLNAAYSLITSWALRLAGVRVIHAACHGGMKQCVLGTNREDLSAPSSEGSKYHERHQSDGCCGDTISTIMSLSGACTGITSYLPGVCINNLRRF